MDPRFDLTSSISEFKNLQLNSPNGPFPAAPSCESEFDPHLFSYPTPPQQTMPQHFYDVLPPLENHIYSPEEASDSDSSIQTPQSITSPTAEIHNWPQTPDRANEQVQSWVYWAIFASKYLDLLLLNSFIILLTTQCYFYAASWTQATNCEAEKINLSVVFIATLFYISIMAK